MHYCYLWAQYPKVVLIYPGTAALTKVEKYPLIFNIGCRIFIPLNEVFF